MRNCDKYEYPRNNYYRTDHLERGGKPSISMINYNRLRGASTAGPDRPALLLRREENYTFRTSEIILKIRVDPVGLMIRIKFNTLFFRVPSQKLNKK